MRNAVSAFGVQRGGRRPGGAGPQIPEIDEIVKKGQEQLRVLMGGRGGRPGGPDGGSGGPGFSKGTIVLGLIAAVGVWAFSSFYTVRPEERSVELFLGEFSSVGEPGLNFAPWPFVTYEVLPVTQGKREVLLTFLFGEQDRLKTGARPQPRGEPAPSASAFMAPTSAMVITCRLLLKMKSRTCFS